MEIIRAAALKEQRWRNGGGVTRELAAGDVGTDGLPGWRLSLADISSDGSFSEYPGVDRIFTIVDGDVAFLTVDGSQHRMERYRPFRFDGGSSADCSLPTGPCRALNVMTRRGACSTWCFCRARHRRRLTAPPSRWIPTTPSSARARPRSAAAGSRHWCRSIPPGSEAAGR